MEEIGDVGEKTDVGHGEGASRHEISFDLGDRIRRPSSDQASPVVGLPRSGAFYLLQVALPQLDLSAQGFSVPLDGRLVSLPLRHQVVVVDDHS